MDERIAIPLLSSLCGPHNTTVVLTVASDCMRVFTANMFINLPWDGNVFANVAQTFSMVCNFGMQGRRLTKLVHCLLFPWGVPGLVHASLRSPLVAAYLQLSSFMFRCQNVSHTDRRDIERRDQGVP